MADEIRTAREQQLEAALLDFYYAADRVVRELNIVQPFTALAVRHAAVLRTLPAKPGREMMIETNGAVHNHRCREVGAVKHEPANPQTTP